MTESFVARSESCTDKGNVRQINEDACLDLPEKRLWAVADGMGGHDAGDIASRMIVDALRRLDNHAPPGECVDELEETLIAVNRSLQAKAQERDAPTVIGSTVVALLAFPRHCLLAWAGDSRVYRLRAGKLMQLTRDHSEVEDLITQGLLKREEAEEHAAANVITRAVGGTSDFYLDLDLHELAEGDRFLLCTDGLYKELSDAEIEQVLSQPADKDASRALVDAALAADGADNVTVIVVDFAAQPELRAVVPADDATPAAGPA